MYIYLRSDFGSSTKRWLKRKPHKASLSMRSIQFTICLHACSLATAAHTENQREGICILLIIIFLTNNYPCISLLEKPGRTREELTELKSLILLKLGTNIKYIKRRVWWVNDCGKKGQNNFSLQVRESPCKNDHLTPIYAYSITHLWLSNFYNKKSQVKMKTTGSWSTSISLKAQISISTGPFDLSSWLHLRCTRYILHSFVNSPQLIANIYNGQKQIHIILDLTYMESESNQ